LLRHLEGSASPDIAPSSADGVARVHWLSTPVESGHWLQVRADVPAGVVPPVTATARTTCLPQRLPAASTVLLGIQWTMLQQPPTPVWIMLELGDGRGRPVVGEGVALSLRQHGQPPLLRADWQGLVRWEGNPRKADKIVIQVASSTYGDRA
jgi:hypothetical protein